MTTTEFSDKIYKKCRVKEIKYCTCEHKHYAQNCENNLNNTTYQDLIRYGEQLIYQQKTIQVGVIQMNEMLLKSIIGICD